MEQPPIVYEGDNGEIVFRASAVGSCTKALIAAYMEFEPVQPPQWIKEKMDESGRLEDYIIELVNKEISDTPHWPYVASQRTVEHWFEYEGVPVVIRGRIDGFYPDNGNAPLEIKAFGQSMWDQWKRGRFDNFPAYADQATAYWYGCGAEYMHYAVYNKDTGELDLQKLEAPPSDIKQLQDKCKHVIEEGESGELPEQCDKENFICPFVYLHEDTTSDIEGEGEGGEVEIFDALCHQYKEADAEEKRGKAKKDEVKKRIKEYLDSHIDPDSKGKVKAQTERYKVSWVVKENSKPDREKLAEALGDLEPYFTKYTVEYPYVTEQ